MGIAENQHADAFDQHHDRVAADDLGHRRVDRVEQRGDGGLGDLSGGSGGAIDAMLEFIGEHVQAEVAEQFRTEIVAVDEIAVVGEGNAVPVLDSIGKRTDSWCRRAGPRFYPGNPQ